MCRPERLVHRANLHLALGGSFETRPTFARLDGDRGVPASMDVANAISSLPGK